MEHLKFTHNLITNSRLDVQHDHLEEFGGGGEYGGQERGGRGGEKGRRGGRERGEREEGGGERKESDSNGRIKIEEKEIYESSGNIRRVCVCVCVWVGGWEGENSEWEYHLTGDNKIISEN